MADTEFAVMRYNWRPDGGNWILIPERTRVLAFDSCDEAEAERARREANARFRVGNPFRCAQYRGVGDVWLGELTSLPPAIFCDWVRDTGLEPPPDARGWEEWWDTLPKPSAEQVARVWAGLDRVRFFDVEERPTVPLGYALVLPHWYRLDRLYVLKNEGGEVAEVYRTRDSALAQFEPRSGGWRGESRQWFPSGADLFDPETHYERAMHGTPGCDAVEIELCGIGDANQKVYLVARQTWDGGRRERKNAPRVPIRAFASRRDPDAHRHDLEEAFHRKYDVWDWLEGWWSDAQSLAVESAGFDLGLIPPGLTAKTMDPYRVGRWWNGLATAPTEDQRAALWTAASVHDVYGVVEVELKS